MVIMASSYRETLKPYFTCAMDCLNMSCVKETHAVCVVLSCKSDLCYLFVYIQQYKELLVGIVGTVSCSRVYCSSRSRLAWHVYVLYQSLSKISTTSLINEYAVLYIQCIFKFTVYNGVLGSVIVASLSSIKYFINCLSWLLFDILKWQLHPGDLIMCVRYLCV